MLKTGSVVNSPPIATNQTIDSGKNSPTRINLTASDKDGDFLNYTILTGPNHGTLEGKQASLIFIPSLNYTGLDNLTFKANDGKADSNIAMIDINVRDKVIPLQTVQSAAGNHVTSSKLGNQTTTSTENNNGTVNHPNDNAKSKTIPPKRTDKNVTTAPRNILPNANAGKNQIAVEGSQVILDGSKSKDRDGKIDLYHWQQITGPKVSIDNSNDTKASFISPSVNHDTILVFKLTVVDDKDGSNSAITTVKIVKNQESPSATSNKANSPASNPDANSVKAEDIANSTRG